jgi:hypothetical protein
MPGSVGAKLRTGGAAGTATDGEGIVIGGAMGGAVLVIGGATGGEFLVIGAAWTFSIPAAR